MAINIFSGAAKPTASKPRLSSAKERADATTSAINGTAVASNSGSTAVKAGGVLGKIASFANGVSGLLKHAPGPLGNVANIVNKLTNFNDPEWWMTIPGDGLSANAPLADNEVGTFTHSSTQTTMYNEKPAFLEFTTFYPAPNGDRIMTVNARMITQYIMPAVRKVTNAITLQDATSYQTVLQYQATLYALWRQLKKYDYFLKHGQTFVPNTNDAAFPVLQVSNAAWLQSTITRLEEYLHANVRLPHTLCEYLTWRFGRIFRSNPSAKAAFVLYDFIPMTAAISVYDDVIASIMNTLTSTEALQKAVSDLYNAYLDHDQEVLINDATLIFYDCKEFALRTNLDLLGATTGVWSGIKQNAIIMDSNLDNPTVFMASTISTTHGGGDPLFPVQKAITYLSSSFGNSVNEGIVAGSGGTGDPSTSSNVAYTPINGSVTWKALEIYAGVAGSGSRTGSDTLKDFLDITYMALAAKSVDFYNVGLFLTIKCGSAYKLIDMTSISIDSGNVPDLVIENEQVIAFANLMTEEHKNATTYKVIEKRAAKDVANFIESNEVATLSK